MAKPPSRRHLCHFPRRLASRGARACLAALLVLGMALAAGAGGERLYLAHRGTGAVVWQAPAERVAEVVLTVHHSLEGLPVREGFLLAGGRLMPRWVEYAADTYDLRDTRYPGAPVKVEGGRVRVGPIPPGAAPGWRMIPGRVAHLKAQELLVRYRDGGEERVSLARVGPGGTPYALGVGSTPGGP